MESTCVRASVRARCGSGEWGDADRRARLRPAARADRAAPGGAPRRVGAAWVSPRARRPGARRDEARLLVVSRASGDVRHATFRDLPDALPPGTLTVLNDTRVVPARI